MRKFFLLPLLAFAVLVVNAVTADAQFLVNREAAKRFATMPSGAEFPEGITADGAGNIYVGTFKDDTSRIVKFDPAGNLLADSGALGAPILGLVFGPDGKIYFCFVGDFTGSGSQIKRISADLTTIEDVAVVPGIGAPPDRDVDNPDGSTDRIIFGDTDLGFIARVPNALTFNAAGDQLFFSDSFQGAIFRIDDPTTCISPCVVTTVLHDGLLATAGFPPFGANGVALNGAEDTLFVANTGDDRVLTQPIDGSGDADGALAVFAESINGADGIAFDDDGRPWVVANQADEMVALDATGKVIAKLGDFLGIRNDGAVNGLVFPASVVIHDGHMFVTNAALDLTGNGVEGDVSTYTVSRIKIPNFTGAESSD